MEEKIQQKIVQSYIKANNLMRLEGIEGVFLSQGGKKRVKLDELLASPSFEGFRDGFEQNHHRDLNLTHFFNKMFFEPLSYKNLGTPLNYVHDFFVKTLEYNTGYLIGVSYAFNSK